MNLKFSPTTTPAGSRFLYRNMNGFLKEGTIREWAKSGDYLNWDGQWITVRDANNFTLVEILPEDDLWKDKTQGK